MLSELPESVLSLSFDLTVSTRGLGLTTRSTGALGIDMCLLTEVVSGKRKCWPDLVLHGEVA